MNRILEAEYANQPAVSKPVYYSGDYFRGLEEEKKTFTSLAVLRKVKKNEYVYSEGEVSNSLFYIDKGSVRLTRTNLNGKEISYAINNAGSVFGISASLYGKRRLVNAQTLTDSRLYEMGIDKFKLLTLQYPSMSERVIEILVKRVGYLVDSYLSVICDSAENRMCKFMAYNYYPILLEMKDKGIHRSLPHVINQSDIATYLGISRQRTNELLHCLNNKGVIKVQRNTITFLNPEYLLSYI